MEGKKRRAEKRRKEKEERGREEKGREVERREEPKYSEWEGQRREGGKFLVSDSVLSPSSLTFSSRGASDGTQDDSERKMAQRVRSVLGFDSAVLHPTAPSRFLYTKEFFSRKFIDFLLPLEKTALKRWGGPLNLIPDHLDGSLNYTISSYLRKLKQQVEKIEGGKEKRREANTEKKKRNGEEEEEAEKAKEKRREREENRCILTFLAVESGNGSDCEFAETEGDPCNPTAAPCSHPNELDIFDRTR